MQNNRQGKLLLILLSFMFLTLFASRALLSVSTIVFLMVTLIHQNIGRQLKTFAGNGLLVAITILFFIPFISGLWSEDSSDWQSVVRVKLPLLFFPLAFAGRWIMEKKQWTILTVVIIGIMFLATLWSLSDYLLHPDAMHEAYLRAKLIRTPFENDHVRFSWTISIGVLCCLYLVEDAGRRARIFLLLVAAWFIIYLHILSARTGLLCSYVILFLYLARLIVRFRRKALGIGGITILIVLPVVAWLFLPTFQNRLRYMLYDLGGVTAQTYRPGSNDGARSLSLQAGWQILKEHPLGVGAGDVFRQANQWYDVHVPGMLAEDKLFPSSEWLLYACAAGWPGVVLFSAAMIYILFYRCVRHRFFWFLLQLTALLSFLLDIGLESQYGVFLYCFFTLLFWKQWQEEENVKR